MLINDRDEVLLSDERYSDAQFSKFPGGGLEYGEGLIDCVKREFIEECNMEIEVIRHFYTTDFFVKSLFIEGQLISIYYIIKNVLPVIIPIKNTPFDFDAEGDVHAFRWARIADLQTEDVTFPVDKHVVELLKSEYGVG